MSNLKGSILKGRYFLRELVGSGGTADVYLAWDQVRSTRVAIKIVRGDLQDQERFQQLFSQEAQVLRNLEHPNIVRLYEFEQEGSRVFFVMDWVDGENIRQILQNRKTPFTVLESTRVLESVCAALNYAHLKQIYHCDIKPANILQRSDGRVLLCDFGVARLAKGDHTGGTPPYMAPEQFMGSAVTAATDIYSLGVTLFEMLSGGVLPFRGMTSNSQGSTTSERIAWEHVNSPTPSVRQFNPNLSKSIEQILFCALNKEPKQRFTSTMELWDAFERARLEISPSEKGDATVFTPITPISPTDAPTHNQPIGTQTPPSRGAYIYCQQGDHTGRFFPITSTGLKLGRSSVNQIRLSEKSISREHATIIFGKKGYYIRDENSMIGVYLNGNRINGVAQLHPGDWIQIGYQQLFQFLIS